MIRILLSSIILALGISGAAFAFKNIDNPLASAPKQIAEIKSNNKVDLNQPFKQAEKPLASASQTADNSKTEIFDDSGQNNGNLTDLFVQKIKNEILQNNPQGPMTVDGKPQIQVPDTEELTTNFINEAQTEFNIQDFIPEISNADLKISNDNSRSAILNYAEAFDQNVENSRTQLSNSPETFTMETINQSIDIFKNGLEKFYKLTVPSQMLNVHKTEIKYLSAELALLEKIKNVNTDPMGAMIASQNFEALNKEFSKNINAEVQKIMDKIKITHKIGD